jgi:hypothetical protein
MKRSFPKSIFFPILLGAFLFQACKAEWSDREKEKIKSDCLLAAEKYGFTDPEAHCDCVLRTIINRYPNPNQFENMEMGEFGQIVNECQGQDLTTRIIWPEKTQKAFLDSCAAMAKTMGKKEPKVYCSCVLEEMIRRYPTNDSIGKITPGEMGSIGKGCEAANPKP